MNFRMLHSVLVLLVLVLTPALSYADGCCCLNASEQSESRSAPCHDNGHEGGEITGIDANIMFTDGFIDGCLCDFATSHAASVPYSENSVRLILVSKADQRGLYSGFTSISSAPLLRPPISFA